MLLRRNYNGSRHPEASKVKKKVKKNEVQPVPIPPPRRRKPTGLEAEPEDDEEDEDAAEEDEEVAVEAAAAAAEEERHLFTTVAELIKPMKVVVGRFEITTTHLYFYPEHVFGNGAKQHKIRKWALSAGA